jgi:hypothetical protein
MLPNICGKLEDQQNDAGMMKTDALDSKAVIKEGNFPSVLKNVYEVGSTNLPMIPPCFLYQGP